MMYEKYLTWNRLVERNCILGSSNEIEIEYHFFMVYPVFEYERKYYINHLDQSAFCVFASNKEDAILLTHWGRDKLTAI